MTSINRREFGALALAALATRARAAAPDPVGDVVREGAGRRLIPAVAGMVASADKTLWSGAYGKRDTKSGVAIQPDSIFYIASMTKAITTTAALQLVEQGKVGLQEPLSKFLPELGKLDVITGFASDGKPILRPATKPVTLHHLLTHTSGFAYDTWEGNMFKYATYTGSILKPQVVAPLTPLVFEPGTRWQYGISIDWAGKLVEKISGLTLEQYFQRNILQPLGMNDTSFILAPAKFNRLVSTWRKQTSGDLKEDPRAQPAAPAAYNGGGGLYSTAPDYVKFMQMILHKGRGPAGKPPILSEKTVAMMQTSQIGDLIAGRLTSYRKERSDNVDLHPGFRDTWGYGFLINTVAYPGGRSAGSLAWAGVENTYYWIDPARKLCAVLMMQYFPFVDRQAVGLLSDFEKAVYTTFAAR